MDPSEIATKQKNGKRVADIHSASGKNDTVTVKTQSGSKKTVYIEVQEKRTPAKPAQPERRIQSRTIPAKPAKPSKTTTRTKLTSTAASKKAAKRAKKARRGRRNG